MRVSSEASRGAGLDGLKSPVELRDAAEAGQERYLGDASLGHSQHFRRSFDAVDVEVADETEFLMVLEEAAEVTGAHAKLPGGVCDGELPHVILRDVPLDLLDLVDAVDGLHKQQLVMGFDDEPPDDFEEFDQSLDLTRGKHFGLLVGAP